MTYHAGELAVQTRAGVKEEAQQVSKVISSDIKPASQHFLRSQRLAIASTVGTRFQVWASVLTGEPGFMQALSEQTVRINAAPVPGDPLGENLLLRDEIGLLAIDLATRRRLRLNGKAQVQSDGSIHINTRQVYFNCPQYIQVRYLDAEVTRASTMQPKRAETITFEQQQWIEQTDTFFIASFHPEGGADASHRGGYPGFVKVLNASQLVFPDYQGNNMFNTLGNISLNPQAGLLFIDFSRGSTLQLTGQAHIVWDAERTAEFVGAERLIEFHVDRALEVADAIPLRWR